MSETFLSVKQKCPTCPHVVSTSNSGAIEEGNADYERASSPGYLRILLKAVVLCGIDSSLNFQRDTQPTVLVIHGFHIRAIYGISVLLSTDQPKAPKLDVH